MIRTAVNIVAILVGLWLAGAMVTALWWRDR